MLTSQSSGTERRHWVRLISLATAVVITPNLFALVQLPEPGLLENRVLAKAPSMPESVVELSVLPLQVDAYVRDHFPLRQHFIAALNLARYQLGYSALAQVVVGRAGWLFFNQGHFFHHMGVRRLESAALQGWISRFTQRVDDLAKREASQFLLIAPEKPSVYPEKLPSWLKVSMTNEIDDILGSIPLGYAGHIIFPLKELIAAKRQQDVFGPYDTHWNGCGAYVAYVSLIERISAKHPLVGKPLPLSEFKLSKLTASEIPHGLAQMIGVGNLVEVIHPSFATYPQHDPERTIFLSTGRAWWASQVIKTDTPNNQTLLLIRDSFSIELLPFLKRHFETIILAHAQNGFMRDDLIEQYHPQVVLTEVIESTARNAF